MKHASFMINRWLLSTSAKDIGVKYIIFAGLSGIVGSSLSFKIRLELKSGGEVYFLGENHQYNVVITGHALLKIFLCAYVLLFCLNTYHILEFSQYSIKELTYLDPKGEGDHSMSV